MRALVRWVRAFRRRHLLSSQNTPVEALERLLGRPRYRITQPGETRRALAAIKRRQVR